jgi:hypothetical protein
MTPTHHARVSSKGLESLSRFPRRFVRRGFYERDIAKITSGTLLCVLHRAEAIGGQVRKARPRPSEESIKASARPQRR